MAAIETREGKIAVIGSNIMSLGFRFAGIKRSTTLYQSDTPEMVEKNLREALSDPAVAIVVIAGSLLQKVRDRRLKQLAENSIFPIVLPVPDFKEEAAAEDSLRNLIKRAIGIDINTIRQNQTVQIQK